MSTSSVPHSVELDDDDDDDVASAAVVRKSRPHKKYATLEKCNSLINLNGNLASLARSATSAAVNFEWYKQFRRNARVQMMKSRTKSTDAAPSTAAITLRRSSSTMQYNSSSTAVKAVNRDGTIARNHFRGVPGDFLDKHTKHFLLSMTTEELYEEILYEILHNVGCETENETCQTTLYSYIQDAFKMTNQRHDELLSAASQKKPPEMRLNVEVVEAKELQPKDPNGMSDPFVTMYIQSNPSHRYNTSVKSSTLNPAWEEHFSLPLNENLMNDDHLVIEVWDFDPAETVGEKMSKILDIKGVRGFRKLMKEIAVTASTGKHDNELIGRCSIPLKTISTSGLCMWFSLEKKSKPRNQGLIKLRLSFSAEKNTKVAVQEHKHLLRIVLLHELEMSKVAPYWWSGKFSDQGEAVIAQHAAQSGISANARALAQWSAFTTIHANHALSFKLFESLLDKLVRLLNSAEISMEDRKMFWEGVKKLLPSCYSIIRNIRKKTSSDKNCMKMLTEVLSILSVIGKQTPPADTELFPKKVYGWLNKSNVNFQTLDIRAVIEEAIRSGAQDYLFQINEIRDVHQENDEENLQNIIKITQLVRADLQRGVEFYDRLFSEKVQCNYSSICYMYYERELTDSFQMTIERACKHLKRIAMPEEGEELRDQEEVNMGTTLFEVYLILKRFADLSTRLCPDATTFRIQEYHDWFTSGVAHWLDISLYKALKRIEKAIELDKLTPVDDTVKYSTSAVDALAIFYQIKIFWQQLNWPDVEGCYTFIAKIVDDICRCCVFYADRMSARVEGLGNIQDMYDGHKFVVTPEWCLAINNIDYMRQSLPQFIKELQVEEIIGKLAEYRSQAEAQRCEDTLKNVVDNAVDTEENKIVELIQVVARKMCPPMRKFLVEGAEVLHQDSNSMDRLMMYLEDSLKTLNTELNEVNFQRILSAIWEELAIILRDLVQTNLDKRRPPQFFSNLRECLRIMVKCFKCGEVARTCVERETLAETERLLQLHSYETCDLIHQYYVERHREQTKMNDSPYGQLTIRGHFTADDLLELEVVNARNLVPTSSNGSCDPFVRFHFSPEEKFGMTLKYKTNVQNKTLFPLFDEKFVIPISKEQRAIPNGMIMFCIKDQDLFGISNKYISECFVTFEQIASTGRLEQIHLKLSRPTGTDCECLNALKLREGDKLARDFVKKIKQKIP